MFTRECKLLSIRHFGGDAIRASTAKRARTRPTKASRSSRCARRLLRTFCRPSGGSAGRLAVRRSVLRKRHGGTPKMALSEQWLASHPNRAPFAQGERWHVFLSYRSVNRIWVMNLYDVLHQQGFEVFLDQVVLAGGDELIRVLEDGLEQSQAGVLVWSSSTGDSDWVRREYQTLERQAGERDRVLLRAGPARSDEASGVRAKAASFSTSVPIPTVRMAASCCACSTRSPGSRSPPRRRTSPWSRMRSRSSRRRRSAAAIRNKDPGGCWTCSRPAASHGRRRPRSRARRPKD